jgi:hypothetical protein
MDSRRSDVCGVFLLLVEVGPHFRIDHPDDRAHVTLRLAS